LGIILDAVAVKISLALAAAPRYGSAATSLPSISTGIAFEVCGCALKTVCATVLTLILGYLLARVACSDGSGVDWGFRLIAEGYVAEKEVRAKQA
jgi:hypothetical protein